MARRKNLEGRRFGELTVLRFSHNSNCISCCGIVNKMKGTMSQEDFLNVCREVFDNG